MILSRPIAESTFASIIKPHIHLKPMYPIMPRITATTTIKSLFDDDFLLEAIFDVGISPIMRVLGTYEEDERNRVDYPELELSTNLAENSIRPIAVGRKNWIHLGSPQAGPKVAAILSIFETCRRIKLPVREYLSAVLPGLANRQLQRLSDLTPTAWVGQHSQSTSQRD